VTLLAPLEGDEQRSTSTHAQTLKEATRISAGKAKHQVKLHPEGMRMEVSNPAGTNNPATHDNLHDMGRSEMVETEGKFQWQTDGSHRGGTTKKATMPEIATCREKVAVKTVNTTSAAMTSKEWDTMEKEFSLTRLRSCCADPGGFVRAGEIRIADLIYLNGYVPFCIKNIQDRLTPCSTRHFVIVTNGTRTR
jgi:hypothetical protein